MDVDLSLEVHHRFEYDRPYKVTLTRGASGAYRWEIEVRGSEPNFTVGIVGRMDDELCKRYGGLEAPGEEE